MNIKQLITIWVGIGIIVLMTLFPPTLITSLKKGDEVFEELSIKTLKSKGYYEFHEAERPVFIFSTNTNATEKKIQYGKMFLCHLIVSLITIGLIITFNTKKSR